MDKQNQSLVATMSSLLTVCREFHLLLQEEQEILSKKRDINIFTDLLSRKTDVFDRLSTCEKEFFASLGISHADQITPNMTEHLKKDPTIQPIWDQLRDLLKKCDEQNRLNGVVVNHYTQQTRRFLDFLLPQEGAETYNAHGNIK